MYSTYQWSNPNPTPDLNLPITEVCYIDDEGCHVHRICHLYDTLGWECVSYWW